MFVTKMGAKAWRSSIAFIKNLTHNNSVTKNVNAKRVDSCGLTLSTLGQDTIQISSRAKQTVTTPLIETPSGTFEVAQVSMHHNLHGGNTSYRDVYKTLTSDKPIDADNLRWMPELLPKMHKIDKEFANLPPLERDCIVWRGRAEHPLCKYLNEDFRIIDNAKVGDVIIPDASYSYTAFDKSLASHWSSSIEGRTMMYKIRLPKGAKVSRNLEHGGEAVMPRNAEYRLISKTTNGEHIEVELEYILPKKDNVAEIEELMKKFQ